MKHHGRATFHAANTTSHLDEAHGVTMCQSGNIASQFNAQLLSSLIICLISAYDILHTNIRASQSDQLLFAHAKFCCSWLHTEKSLEGVIGGNHWLSDLMNSSAAM